MERTPMQRYEDATGPDGWLTAAGWERLASDLVADSTPWWVTREQAKAMTDRAADCRARAERQRAGALDTLQAISRPL